MTRTPPAQRDTTARGDVTELVIAAALARGGMRLLRPLSSASRYDLAIDNDDGSITRVQCKTGVLRSGRVEFRLYGISGHRTEPVDYRGQVDAFGIYCPQTRESYLVPIDAIANCGSLASLRVLPAKNGQARRVRLAKDFLIEATPDR